VSKKIEYPHSVHVAWVNRGSERGPAASPLASKLSEALHMGQTRGPAFLLFRCAANLAVMLVSSTTSPFLRTGDGRSLACRLPSRHPERLPRYDAHVQNASSLAEMGRSIGWYSS
jgi:hypothetical protein